MSNPFADSVENEYNPFAPGAGFNTYDNSSTTANDPPASSSTLSSEPLGGSSSYQPYTPPDSSLNQSYTTPSTRQDEASAFKQSTGLDANPFKAAKGSDGQMYRDPVTGMTISAADLDRREAELARREANIASKEQAIANGTYKPPESRKNFPPVIKMWEYYPEQDLPETSLSIMNIMKWLFYACGLDLLVNFVCAIFTLIPGPADAVDSPASMIVLAGIYFFVFWLLSYEICFFVIYRALRDGKALRFFCGLFVYILWMGFMTFLAVGISDTGAVGMIVTFDIFSKAKKSKWVGVVSLIFSIMTILTILGMVYNFIHWVKFYKAEGLTTKALKEGASMAANYAKEHPDEAKQVATAAYNAGTV